MRNFESEEQVVSGRNNCVEKPGIFVICPVIFHLGRPHVLPFTVNFSDRHARSYFLEKLEPRI